jgi:hypothetical protein
MALSRGKTHEGRQAAADEGEMSIRQHVLEGWGIFRSWRRQLPELHVLNASNAPLYSNMLKQRVFPNNKT